MAIDDNTTYGLTGAQVKDLAQRISAGGGGPTVVQTTGTSTTDVMSQKAVTDMIFNPNAPTTGVASSVNIGIGASSSSMGYSIAIDGSADYNAVGLGGSAQGYGTTALGFDSQAIGYGAIALGKNCSVNGRGVMGIGTTNATYGYNSSNYRLLTGVYDGQSAHDAVNVSQVNSVIDAINTALSTNIPHIGA